MTAAEKFRSLLQSDLRFDPEAYNFVYEALDYTLKNVVNGKRRPNQHVSGAELLEGIRRLSIEQFGCLVRQVFDTWGIQNTDSFGEIVFNLVEHDLMGKQDSDRMDDFRDVYDFEEVFDITPIFHYSRDKDEWDASYVTQRQLAQLERN
ncbi:MAG: hypothetical protein O7J95_07835 [Planctomycetota bacterium]|nr:hypothetical protein [Planctomycetota bacterium]